MEPLGEGEVVDTLGVDGCVKGGRKQGEAQTSGEAWKEGEGDSSAAREMQPAVALQGAQVKRDLPLLHTPAAAICPHSGGSWS